MALPAPAYDLTISSTGNSLAPPIHTARPVTPHPSVSTHTEITNDACDKERTLTHKKSYKIMIQSNGNSISRDEQTIPNYHPFPVHFPNTTTQSLIQYDLNL